MTDFPTYEMLSEYMQRADRIRVERAPGGGLRLVGHAVTVPFAKPLSESSLHRLVDRFKDPQNPMGLWGNPIWRSPRFAYVHAVDVHRWEVVGVEITPEYMRLYPLDLELSK